MFLTDRENLRYCHLLFFFLLFSLFFFFAFSVLSVLVLFELRNIQILQGGIFTFCIYTLLRLYIPSVVIFVSKITHTRTNACNSHTNNDYLTTCLSSSFRLVFQHADAYLKRLFEIDIQPGAALVIYDVLNLEMS